MTDKQPENSEPPESHSRSGSFSSRGQCPAGQTHSDAHARQQPCAGKPADEQEDSDGAPALLDKYDLSLVDEERELRRQARR
ncbi:hypothetical protein [Phytopseudomonas seleniipraecipitans]|jgi:hypothetical protein|uniref:Uncharacterized protein n=1 Tax=Phytopseudomonas seleniipraecipitans TaxID=640205 RepID=A0A1G7G537_9GAMM|nr:hypothetical protein [Pseudomonas seleniipraecipitans]SDE83129.1 hypothetical protein SAMN05216381_0018 [Pseudomonas seleniipraecipitans]